MHLTNTLTGKKESLPTTHHITLYVCGVTPYDHAHIGHGRCYVSFDLLHRTLLFLGKKVTYCRNFTDIDDKILNRSEKEFGNRLMYKTIANRYIDSFCEDIQQLNCLPVNYEPRVTDNIPVIIQFIQNLIDSGYAYSVTNDVYFRVKKFPDYGKLSKQKIEDLYTGTRENIRGDKEDPLDFALWKGEPEGEFWNSPWGYGRPGWHIECSALARTYLGDHITIHGGGLDLIFPHHENEIAQSETLLGSPFASIWMHNGMVNSNKEKMSKSLGNFFMLKDIFKQFDPMVIRFYFLTHHYRMPIEFSLDNVMTAQKSYEKLLRFYSQNYSDEDLSNYYSPITDAMIHFLEDDLNTPGLFGVLFEHISTIIQDAKMTAAVKNILQNILGLTLQPLNTQQPIEITTHIQRLIDERNKARQEKNWKRSDELRNQLKQLGIEVRDEKI